MSTRGKFGRPVRRRHVFGATTIVALVVFSVLALGSASARPAAHHHGDASLAGRTMSSTHSLLRAERHAFLASRAAGHAAHHSLSHHAFSLLSLSPFFAGLSQPLAPGTITGCGNDGTIADATGFEDADGNLAPNSGCTDWNSFNPT
jgi:hypothetical protein